MAKPPGLREKWASHGTQKWNKFSAFLRDLGPIPELGYTLDKDSKETGYGPGVCDWRSKQAQTWNRSNTVSLTYNNETMPLAVLAKRTGQAESTVRLHHKQGWPVENIISGKPPEKFSPAKFNSPPFGHPWPARYSDQWETHYQRDTNGHADRLWYLAHHSAKTLGKLYDSLDSVCYPDGYEPTADEQQTLDALTAKFNMWEMFYTHAKQQVEKRGGSMRIDDAFLDRYR